jgi:putative peptidoglycan lipid II flippase
VKLTIRLGILSVANLGIAFLFQWYVLLQLGPGVETDALFAGMTIPQIVLAVISGSLMHVLVPLLSGESDDQLLHDAWAFVALIGSLFGLLAFLLYAGAPWWVPLSVPGFDETGQVLTVELTRVQLIGMVLAAINGVQLATYHARQQFLWAEFAPMLATAVALLLLVWALPRFGVIAAAWIGILRQGLQTLLLAPGMGRPARPDLKSPTVREAWHRIKPLLLGTAYYKTDLLVDRFLLSMAGSGSLSLYYLAQQIYGASSQILNKSIAAPLVPALSRLHKAGDKIGFQRTYKRRMLQVGVISFTGFLVLALFGQSLFALLAGYGQLSGRDLNLLWLMMLLMSGQFVVANLGMVMISMFFSLGDTKSPTIVGVVAYSLGVGIKVLMFYVMGALGLALGVSIYHSIALFLMARKISEKKYA